LAVDFREADSREADFAGRLTIVIAAFPRRVIAGPPRAVLLAAAGHGFGFGMFLALFAQAPVVAPHFASC
jgi:hypothetical protein